MPDCAIVKSMNTPTAYSGIRAWVEPPPAIDDERGDRAQDDDPGRVGEPVAAERELARDEPVLGEHGGEARECRERRVRGEEQQQRRERLEQVEQHRVAVDVVRDLGDDGLLGLLDRQDVEARGEERDRR